MYEARRPTTASSASITTHFFVTSAGFREAVVFVCIENGPDFSAGTALRSLEARVLQSLRAAVNACAVAFLER
jgi:hypothetical protein